VHQKVGEHGPATRPVACADPRILRQRFEQLTRVLDHLVLVAGGKTRELQHLLLYTPPE